MNVPSARLSLLALTLCAAALPALGSSTTASSASDGASSLVGSVSDSFEASSDSSSKKDTAAAVGDYKVLAVNDVVERPGVVRLTLQALKDNASADDTLMLYVPAKVLAQHPLHNGEVVSAKPRPYGVEFARADTGRAFFLVLQDSWYRELKSNAVVL